MIVFEGEKSKQTIDYIVKNNFKIATTVAVVMAVPMIIAIIYFAVKYDLIYLIALICPLLFVALAGIKPKDLSLIVADRIEIDEYNILAYSDKFTVMKEIAKVQKVVDMREFYAVFFNNFHASSFICQKDLIKEGTIEQFEELFKGKIVTQNQKKR